MDPTASAVRLILAVALLSTGAAGAAERAAEPAVGPDASPAPGEPPTTDPPAAGDAFDPWKGIERSGRIPAVEKPPDLPNPERWRYYPEGRLKPGNMLQRFGISSFIAPFAFRSSDVGWGGGVAVVDIDFRAQRRREFAGIFASYTEEQQQGYWFVWRRWLHHVERPQGGVFQEERSFVRLVAGYSDTLTRSFFGFGVDSRDDDESRYADEQVNLSLGIQRTWPEPGDDLIWRLGLRGEIHNLGAGLDTAPSCPAFPAPLDPMTLAGPRCATQDRFPGQFWEVEDRGLGFLEAGIAWDTRDSQANPYAGWILSADVQAALVQSGGEVGATYALRAGKVFELPGLLHRGGDPDEAHPPTDSLVLTLRTHFSSGELPFFERPALGGDDRLRGYIGGRFRDKHTWFGGAEYRFWVLPRGIPIWGPIRIERLGVALFYEVGSVAKRPVDLFVEKVRHSYGPSLRITLERTAPFRIDFAFAPNEGMNIVARFGLSF